ncbi:MAG TPA: hypothetical protein VE987_14080, partial [Polyangiaceae bacterium]|nr:hypothetical protein [Polyangiaceae bacterium]
MGATEFLYGDSTPSPLTTDFIGLLDEAFDFAVQVLLHDGMVVDAAQRVARMSQALDGEVQGAQAMVDDVSRLLARAADCQESLAARCAARIRQGIEEVVRSEAESARASIDSERARLSQTAASARGACARAFERLVVAQELPGTVAATAVRLEGGDRYEAQLLCRTPYGLRWTVGLAIAPSHALAHAARI